MTHLDPCLSELRPRGSVTHRRACESARLRYHPRMPRSVPRKVGPDELSTLSDEQLLDLQFRAARYHIEGTRAGNADRPALLGARGTQSRFPPALLAVGRVVHARRRPRRRDPLLSGAPAPRETGARADARGRRRRSRLVHADPAARGGPCDRQRVPSAPPPAAARAVRQLAEPYPEFYTPKPYSKSFVLHLDSWYAQSHPDEDFAETFAVWLTPTQRVAAALSRTGRR